MNTRIFEEIADQLSAVLEVAAGQTGVETRRHGGNHIHASRMASIAFWINALDADANAVNSAKLKLAALDRRLRQIAVNAGLEPGAGDLRDVLTLFGHKLSDDARRWSMAVWNASRPIDKTGIFAGSLQRRLEAEEWLRRADALDAEVMERETAAERAAEMRERAARLLEVGAGTLKTIRGG